MSISESGKINYTKCNNTRHCFPMSSFNQESTTGNTPGSSSRSGQRRLRAESLVLQKNLIELTNSPEKEVSELLIKYSNNAHGYSAIQEAVFQKDYRAIDLFFSYGFTAFPQNRSLLLIATLSDDEQMVDYLMKKGCQFNGNDLSVLATSEKSIEKINFLKIKAQNLACLGLDFNGLVNIIQNSNPETIDLLLNNGVNMNITQSAREMGETVMVNALSYAAKRGNLQIAKALIEHGVEINAGSYAHGTWIYGTNWNPLTTAVLSHHYDIATYLIEKGASVPWSVPSRRDPKTGASEHLGALLKQAAEDKAYSFVTLLLKNGCPSSFSYNDGTSDTLLIRAVKIQDVKLVEAFLEGGANPNESAPLKLAIDLKNADLVAVLIKYKARID